MEVKINSKLSVQEIYRLREQAKASGTTVYNVMKAEIEKLI